MISNFSFIGQRIGAFNIYCNTIIIIGKVLYLYKAKVGGDQVIVE